MFKRKSLKRNLGTLDLFPLGPETRLSDKYLPSMAVNRKVILEMASRDSIVFFTINCQDNVSK